MVCIQNLTFNHIGDYCIYVELCYVGLCYNGTQLSKEFMKKIDIDSVFIILNPVSCLVDDIMQKSIILIYSLG